jgi:hypothetical protein
MQVCEDSYELPNWLEKFDFDGMDKAKQTKLMKHYAFEGDMMLGSLR